MMELISYLHPENILIEGGFWILILIVFLESGFFFGFFLPGDSLLFTSGLLCGTGIFAVDITLLMLGLSVAAIGGYIVGYYTGKLFSGFIRRKDNKLIRKRHLELTEAFYHRHGIAAVIIGRFIPIVRTFAPILAGMVYAPFGKFMMYNVLGAFIWIILLVYSGYWLGEEYPGVSEYLEIIIISLIVLSAIPAVSNLMKKKLQKS